MGDSGSRPPASASGEIRGLHLTDNGGVSPPIGQNQRPRQYTHVRHPEPAQTAGRMDVVFTTARGSARTRGWQEGGEKGSSFHIRLFLTFPSSFVLFFKENGWWGKELETQNVQ